MRHRDTEINSRDSSSSSRPALTVSDFPEKFVILNPLPEHFELLNFCLVTFTQLDASFLDQSRRQHHPALCFVSSPLRFFFLSLKPTKSKLKWNFNFIHYIWFLDKPSRPVYKVKTCSLHAENKDDVEKRRKKITQIRAQHTNRARELSNSVNRRHQQLKTN